MRVLKLKLENFQGVRAEEYRFNGKNARFYGDNAAGKSTVFNAYTWLLFGKASTGEPNFSPKPRKGDEDVHNVDTSVEMTFTHNGAEHVISRVWSEVWKKKRGNSTAEFSGHETAYFIDRVPVRESDFSNYLADIATPEQFKILTFPLYFMDENKLNWTSRRKILFDACGSNLSDAEVIASNSELAELPAMLGNNTVDDFKKIVAAAMKRTNEQLADIPGRIDEATRAIPETPSTVDEINAVLHTLNRKKAATEQKRADILNSSILGSELRKSISEKEALIAEARSRHLKSNSEATDAIYAEIRAAQTQSGNYETRVISAKRTVEKAEAELKALNSQRDKVKTDYAAVQNEEFNAKSTVCPTCGRKYPPENIEQIKNDFDIRKSARLTAIIENGKQSASKEMVAAKESEIETAKTALEQAVKLLETAQARLATLNDELSVKTGALREFEQTPEYATLKGELDALRSQAADDGKAMSEAVIIIDEEISAVNDDIKRQFELLAAHTTAAAQNERIDELRRQEEELGAEYAAQERRIYLCELFVKSKVAMLDERINGKFKTVRFRLFQEQINGGLKECCDALIPTKESNLVLWNNGANTAAKVNAGLEIISTLAAHWGVDVPVWFDGRESVTALLPISQQIISFDVLKGESKLKLELED
jgi:hypothetical protein